MSTDSFSFSAVPPNALAQNAESATGIKCEPLLIDIAELSRLTSLSVRTLRRLDSAGDVPGRVVCGRRVLFQTETIREWVRAGLPDGKHWTSL